MTTKLQLCADLCREAGISTPPAAVTGQVGEALRVVSWIDAAYEQIQNKHDNWDFLRQDFSFPTVIGVSTYTPASVTPALTELREWITTTFRCYLTVTGLVDEQWMEFVPWPKFRDHYLFSANRMVTGRPFRFSIRPRDKAIITWPIAAALYTIEGEYFQRAQTMDGPSEEPNFPPRFHSAVSWLGLKFYGAYEEAPAVYAHAEHEHGRVMSDLETDQLPEIGTAGAMA